MDLNCFVTPVKKSKITIRNHWQLIWLQIVKQNWGEKRKTEWNFISISNSWMVYLCDVYHINQYEALLDVSTISICEQERMKFMNLLLTSDANWDGCGAVRRCDTSELCNSCFKQLQYISHRLNKSLTSAIWTGTFLTVVRTKINIIETSSGIYKPHRKDVHTQKLKIESLE